MKVEVISKTKLSNKEVLDVNGDTRKVSECVEQMYMNPFTDSTDVRYIYMLAKNEPAPKKGKFAVATGSGIAYIPHPKVRFVEARGGWYRLKSGESFVEVMSKVGNDLVIIEDVLDPFVTVTATDINKRGKVSQVYIQNSDLAKELGYVPALNNDVYVSSSIESKNKELWKRYMQPSSFRLPIRTTHHADSNNPTYGIVNKIYQARKTDKAGKMTKIINQLIGGKSFGLEYEAVNGSIQTCDLGPLGLVPLTDGSIGHENYEFTSVPMEGTYGLETIKAQCQRLTKHCSLNTNCAFHIHIGNVRNDKLTFLSLYTLLYRLQDEVYSMFPFYKQHEIAVLGKSKEYSRRLPDLGLNMNEIYKASSKEEFDHRVDQWHKEVFEYFACESTEKAYHQGKENVPWSRKWHCPTRYFWCNFINYLFSPTGTVEFRIHEPTLNFTKVSSFLLLIVAIIRYAENYPEKILLHEEKIQLSDIINEIKTNFGTAEGKLQEVFTEKAKYLSEYIKYRRHQFKMQFKGANYSSARENGNVFGVISRINEKFIMEDAKFNFEDSRGNAVLY
jgi:hypothetical protein